MPTGQNAVFHAGGGGYLRSRWLQRFRSMRWSRWLRGWSWRRRPCSAASELQGRGQGFFSLFHSPFVFYFPRQASQKQQKKWVASVKAIHGMNRKRRSPPLPLPSIALHKVFLCDSPADLICRANTAGTGSACGISAVSPFPNGHCLCLPPGTFEARASIWNDCLDYSVSLCICKAKFSLESKKNIFTCFCAECIRRRFFPVGNHFWNLICFYRDSLLYYRKMNIRRFVYHG